MKTLTSFEEANQEWMEDKVCELCTDIARRGERVHTELYDLIWEYIEDNLEKYMEEPSYDNVE